MQTETVETESLEYFSLACVTSTVALALITWTRSVLHWGFDDTLIVQIDFETHNILWKSAMFKQHAKLSRPTQCLGLIVHAWWRCSCHKHTFSFRLFAVSYEKPLLLWLIRSDPSGAASGQQLL